MGVWAKLWASGYEFLGKRMQKVEGKYRQRIVEDAHGDVLEIGAGTGFNFPHYQAASRVVAIEPEAAMRRRGESRAQAASVPVELRAGNAHALDFPDSSFDTVVFSLVLCTIPDPDRALAEARRVLKPGGELRVYEHVRSKDPAVAAKQDRWLKPWRAFNVGCHPNRDTVAAISRAGFDVSGVEQFDLNEKGVPKMVRPHAIGVATKQ
jgi:ubiquinone/menaquinone biosynthesis C-methylase UbiE